MPFKPMALDPGRPKWEQQPGETDKSYSRFEVWADLPASERTNVAASTEKVAHRTGRTPRTIADQRSAHRWIERAHAFDSEKRRVHELKQAERAEKLAEQELQLAQGMIRTCMNAVHTVLQNAANLDESLVARWADAAIKLHRQALGDPDKTISLTGSEGGPIEVDAFAGMTPEQRKSRATDLAESVLRLYTTERPARGA